MKHFTKGHKKSGGIKKGGKHKVTLLFKGLTESNKQEILDQALELVRKGNVTIITKFLDKILPNLQPLTIDPEGNVIPEIVIHVRNNTTPT